MTVQLASGGETFTAILARATSLGLRNNLRVHGDQRCRLGARLDSQKLRDLPDGGSSHCVVLELLRLLANSLRDQRSVLKSQVQEHLRRGLHGRVRLHILRRAIIFRGLGLYFLNNWLGLFSIWLRLQDHVIVLMHYLRLRLLLYREFFGSNLPLLLLDLLKLSVLFLELSLLSLQLLDLLRYLRLILLLLLLLLTDLRLIWLLGDLSRLAHLLRDLPLRLYLLIYLAVILYLILHLLDLRGRALLFSDLILRFV